MKSVQLALGVCIAFMVGACAAPAAAPEPTSDFDHNVPGTKTPWTHQNFDSGDDKFTFAIFSDLTGGEREGVFKVAVEQLNLLRPELILSVGDLIEGGTTDRQQLNREWDSFDQRAEKTTAPVFRVPGNHDLTHPVMWEVWEERYGPRYYHFRYRDVLFLVLDTEDNPVADQLELYEIREEAMVQIEQHGWGIFGDTAYGQSEIRRTGAISEQQAAYFRNVIEKNRDVRWTFVVMHKPVWLKTNEVEFATIENALEDRPYTVFYGHVHSYLLEQRRGREYIRLGTTGGVQVERKEMAVDHVSLVTVSGRNIDIANLRMSGIFDRNGKIPLNGEEMCFEIAVCGGETDDDD